MKNNFLNKWSSFKTLMIFVSVWFNDGDIKLSIRVENITAFRLKNIAFFCAVYQNLQPSIINKFFVKIPVRWPVWRRTSPTYITYVSDQQCWGGGSSVSLFESALFLNINYLWFHCWCSISSVIFILLCLFILYFFDFGLISCHNGLPDALKSISICRLVYVIYASKYNNNNKCECKYK